MKPYDDYPITKFTGSPANAYFKCKDDRESHLNEAVFSRLAKLVKVDAAENDLAVQTAGFGHNNYGILSKYDDKIADAYMFFDDIFPSSKYPSPDRIQNVKLDGLFYGVENLSQDFIQKFIENYLFSVLMSNSDHVRCNNFEFLKDKATNEICVAPYFDMERSDLMSSFQTESACEILQGYADNVRTLRAQYKDTHDKFLDLASSVDVPKLMNLNSHHIRRFMKRSYVNVKEYSETMCTNLTAQTEKMKEFSK
ncbi:MAG: hypothetical protein LBG88_04615 [Christensenellaceae bacterium]|jgi:hypothetical protein|nr:hypothetical protein [Christensenellaceae bacterium]